MDTWRMYEIEKAKLKARLERGEITADEYDRLIRALCARLGV